MAETDRHQRGVHWVGVNALRLYADARLLHRAYRFPSSIFLSISCAEECVKYCALWYTARRQSELDVELLRHDKKLSLAVLFSLNEIMNVVRKEWLSSPDKTKELAKNAGLDPEDFLVLIQQMPDEIPKAILLEVFFDPAIGIREGPLNRLFEGFGLNTVRKMALYADLHHENGQWHLSHPMFLGAEMSSDALRIATRAIDFIRGTSEELAAWKAPDVPM